MTDYTGDVKNEQGFIILIHLCSAYAIIQLNTNNSHVH